MGQRSIWGRREQESPGGGKGGAVTGILGRPVPEGGARQAGASAKPKERTPRRSFLPPPPISCGRLPSAKPDWKPEDNYAQCPQCRRRGQLPTAQSEELEIGREVRDAQPWPAEAMLGHVRPGLTRSWP